MHFGCATLEGVELENQGGPGTAMDHWEQRILGVSANNIRVHVLKSTTNLSLYYTE